MVYRKDIKAVVSYFDPQNIPAISLQLDLEIGDHVKSIWSIFDRQEVSKMFLNK